MHEARLPAPMHALVPARLYLRLVLLVALVMMIGAAASAWIIQARMAERNLREVEQEAIALARDLAAALAAEPAQLQGVALRARLSQVIQLPKLNSVALVEPAQDRITAWTRAAPELAPDFIRESGAPRPPPQPEVAIQTEAAGRSLVAWAPVSAASGAWVRIEHHLDHIHGEQRDAWLTSLTSSMAVAAVLIAIMAGYLRRALLPVEQAARFAKQLAARPGTQLRVRGSSREVRALVDSLNDASQRLSEQYEAIHKRDRELAALLDTAADAVVGVDEQARVLLFNSAATSIFGLSAEQAHGRPLYALVPELTEERLRELVDNGVQIGSRGMRLARLESTGLRNGGTEFPVEVAVGAVEVNDAGGSSSLRYTLVIGDITEKRMAEDTLRLYVRALENSNSGIVICDARLPGAPMMYANAAFSQITGYLLGDVIGRTCSFLQGRERDQEAVSVLRRAIAEGRSAAVTLRNYRKDGTPFWNQLAMAPVRDEAGQLTHFVGALNDITERVEAELAIERRSEQLDLILQLSPDGFVLFDGADRLVYANAAFRRMTGLLPEQLTPMSPAALESTLRAMADPKQAWTPLWREDGAAHERVLMQPERRILLTQVDRSGTGADRVLFVRDVTRETEVDRMKSEFLSTAAHELRTPMVSIFGFTELLLKRDYPPERQRSMFQTVHRQAKVIIDLINELLDLARIEARQGKDFHVSAQPLAPIARDAVAGLMVPEDPRKVTLMIEDESLAAAVDADKLRQALRNVLSNAYKYSPGGGEISLRLLSATGADGVEEVGIEVRDAGIGMTPEQAARVFERFYRADPSGNIPGTGLGLCIVKEIVELLGGRVTLDSRIGAGTTVTLWLPRAAASGAAIPLAAEAT